MQQQNQQMPHIQISFSHLLHLSSSFFPFHSPPPLLFGELVYQHNIGNEGINPLDPVFRLSWPFITWFYVLHSKEAMVRFWFSCYQCQIRSLKYLHIFLPHCGITGVKGCGNLWGGLEESYKIYLMWCIAGSSSKEAASLSMNEFGI